MKQLAFFLYVICFLILGVLPASAGSTTLTTYYPAPDGNYNKLTANNEGIGLATAADRLLIAGDTTGYAAFGDPGCGAGSKFAGIGLNSEILAGCTNYNFASDPTDNNLYINRPTNGQIHFRENNADQMMILHSGNVGIGLTPDVNAANIKLEVDGAIAGGNTNLGTFGSMAGFLTNLGNVGMLMGWNRSNGGRESDFMNYGGLGGGGNDGGFRFYVADTSDTVPAVSVIANGNVGVGVVAPTTQLNVAQDGALQIGQAYLSSGGDYAHLANNEWYNGGAAWTTNGNPGALIQLTGQSTNFYRHDAAGNHTLSAVIDSGGNLTDYAWIIVNDNLAGTPVVNIDANQIWATQSSGTATDLYIDYSAPSGSYIVMGGNPGYVTNLNVYGTVTAWGASGAPSDMRLKQNILPLTGTLAKLDQLRAVSFEWNSLAPTIAHKEGEKGIGVIAQELQKVYPELVSSVKNGDKEYLTVDYGKLTAVLLQSVKELKSQMNTMQDKINALQDKVQSLEKQK